MGKEEVVLVDTNVWLDYFVDRGSNHDIAGAFVEKVYREESLQLGAAMITTRDTYYHIRRELKRATLAAEASLSEAAAPAIDEIAWSCLATMRRLSLVVPTAEDDMLEAMLVRHDHGDYEDGLVVAAARRARARYIVTSDQALLRHQPYRCLTPEQALAELEA